MRAQTCSVGCCKHYCSGSLSENKSAQMRTQFILGRRARSLFAARCPRLISTGAAQERATAGVCLSFIRRLGPARRGTLPGHRAPTTALLLLTALHSNGPRSAAPFGGSLYIDGLISPWHLHAATARRNADGGADDDARRRAYLTAPPMAGGVIGALLWRPACVRSVMRVCRWRGSLEGLLAGR